MFSGNHHAQNAEREFQSQGKCECGANDWQDVDICEYDKTQVCELADCPVFGDCLPMPGFYCENCNTVKE